MKRFCNGTVSNGCGKSEMNFLTTQQQSCTENFFGSILIVLPDATKFCNSNCRFFEPETLNIPSLITSKKKNQF